MNENDEDYESYDGDDDTQLSVRDLALADADLDDSDDDFEDDDDSDDDDSDDDDDDDSDDDDDDDDDELTDAGEDEIDFVISAHREDGSSVVQALADDLANDLEELIIQLRRLPGDAGAIGFVSLVEELFVIVRVRGRNVQVLLSDATAANDFPIARDVADFLGEDVPDEDEDGDPMGDLGLLSDLGVSELDVAAACDDLDSSSDEILSDLAERIRIGPQFRKLAEAAFAD